MASSTEQIPAVDMETILDSVSRGEGIPAMTGAEMESIMLPADKTPQTASPDVMAHFLAALQQMSADNRDNMIAAIQEMKKPSPEEQEKADRDKAQLLEQTMRRVEAAMAQAEEIAERQLNCAHTMPNGQTNFRGQVNSNGWAHVFCSHCHKTYDFQATDVEANKSGLNVDKWGPNAHQIIKSRAASSASLIPPPAPRIPAGATIIF